MTPTPASRAPLNPDGGTEDKALLRDLIQTEAAALRGTRVEVMTHYVAPPGSANGTWWARVYDPSGDWAHVCVASAANTEAGALRSLAAWVRAEALRATFTGSSTAVPHAPLLRGHAVHMAILDEADFMPPAKPKTPLP